MYMLIFFMMDIYYSVIYFFVLEKKKKQSEQWEGLVQSQLSITWKKLLIISEKNIITGNWRNRKYLPSKEKRTERRNLIF